MSRLLLIRGIARAVPPVVVIYAVILWWRVHPATAIGFAALTFNYPVSYVLIYTAPGSIRGIWRVRIWQTVLLLINAVLLPIVFYLVVGVVPWGFVAAGVVLIAAWYTATAILFQLQDRSPLSPAPPQPPASPSA